MLTAEQAEILRLVRNDQMDPGILPPYYSRWHSWCTVPAPRTEANCRCDVSFERPLITSRPRARSYASRERRLWWKKFKIKRFASGCDEIWDSRSIEGKDKLSTDPFTAISRLWTIFMGFMEFRAGTVGFRVPSLPIFLTVSTPQNLKRR